MMALGEQRLHFNKCPDVAFIFHCFFFFNFTLMLFQFNYSVKLINRYDFSVCNVSARHLICSDCGHQGALTLLFAPFMMVAALDSCRRPHYFITGRAWRQAGAASFHFLFSQAEADLFKS